MTSEHIASEIERAEKRQIAERWRNGTAQIHQSEVERGHSVRMTAVAGDAGPVAEGVGGSPICEGIGGNEAPECHQGLVVIVERVGSFPRGEGKDEEEKEQRKRGHGG